MRRHRNSKTGQKTIRVFQANVGKIPPAHDCALALADSEQYDVVLLREPWTEAKQGRCLTKTHPAYDRVEANAEGRRGDNGRHGRRPEPPAQRIHPTVVVVVARVVGAIQQRGQLSHQLFGLAVKDDPVSLALYEILPAPEAPDAAGCPRGKCALATLAPHHIAYVRPVRGFTHNQRPNELVVLEERLLKYRWQRRGQPHGLYGNAPNVPP